MGTDEDTVRSYETSAVDYAAEAATMPQWVAGEIDAFVDALGGTGRILEIGSGGGRDAREFERRGLSVRCTDVAQAFVDLLRADGFRADRLDPLTDELADPQHPGTPYDGVCHRGRNRELDVLDACWCGEQIQHAMRADQLLVRLEGEQHVGRSASVGDVQGSLLGRLLGATGVLVELAPGRAVRTVASASSRARSEPGPRRRGRAVTRRRNASGVV